MTFDDIPALSSVFVDANTFVYAYVPDPRFGPSCAALFSRIERKEIFGFTSTHVLSDVAHRLMTLEACTVSGLPYAGIAARLNNHPAEVMKLSRFRQAVEAIGNLGISAIPVTTQHVLDAAIISQQTGLLSNDALIVALMRSQGLMQLASYDSDFDSVSGIVRFCTL